MESVAREPENWRRVCFRHDWRLRCFRSQNAVNLTVVTADGEMGGLFIPLVRRNYTPWKMRNLCWYHLVLDERPQQNPPIKTGRQQHLITASIEGLSSQDSDRCGMTIRDFGA
jgi:hypothetical protein